MSGRYVSAVLESGLPPDLKFTAAVLASFADEQGARIWPAIDLVAHLRGISGRQVQQHVKELRRMEILALVRPATQWQPAHYHMVLTRLPARPPYRPPDRQASFLGPPGESPGDAPPLEGSGVKPASPPPGVKSSVPGVKPTSPDPSVRSISTHTDPACAREGAEVKPASPLDPAAEAAKVGGLPLVGSARLVGSDHIAHAWCGRVCVPKFLHREFRRALGGPVQFRGKRLKAFYAETIAIIPAERLIAEEPVKFWRRRYAARYSRTGADRRQQPERRHDGSAVAACGHDTLCESTSACIQRTLREARERKSG